MAVEKITTHLKIVQGGPRNQTGWDFSIYHFEDWKVIDIFEKNGIMYLLMEEKE